MFWVLERSCVVGGAQPPPSDLTGDAASERSRGVSMTSVTSQRTERRNE